MALYVGLMSGTSMDGIDVALLELPLNRLHYGVTKPYSKELQQDLNEVLCRTELTLAQIYQLNTRIGQEFAYAVKDLIDETKIAISDIEAIGSHGQTLAHAPNASIPYTVQLGCAHTIATLTGIPVVADFRTKDLINLGQGAPFAPLYHQALFAPLESPVALVNIGGIANISLISQQDRVRGWDLGPGNCLMDAWILQHHNQPFDMAGTWASKGDVIAPLLSLMLQDPFFCMSAPKSADKAYFSLSWLNRYLEKTYRAVDVQATLLALTAHLIADAARAFQAPIYLCGGGAHNLFLQKTLASLVPLPIHSVEALGFSPDYLEAMMFAWLASKTLNRIPVDLSSITGAKGPSVLGAVYYP
jgi:anhydro-N-acetylmuramic acid kinase